MTKEQLNQLGKTLWAIADDLRGAMNADDFRDYMLSFLFLRYLSDNYETAAKKELGPDYPALPEDDRRAPLAVWYADNPRRRASVRKADAPQGALRHPPGLSLEQHLRARPHPGRGAAANPGAGLQVHRKRVLRQHLPGPVLRDQPQFGKAGRTPQARNDKLCTIITKIGEGIAQFSTDSDILGDAYEYLIGQFAAGSGKKAGEFYTPQTDLQHPVAHRDAGQPGPAAGKKKQLESVLDFACGSGSLLLNVRNQMGRERHRQDLRPGKEHHHLQPGPHEHAAARRQGQRVRDLPRRHARPTTGTCCAR